MDPDEYSHVEELDGVIDAINDSAVDIILVGGSLIANDLFEPTVAYLKATCSKPVIIFPGNGLQISSKADGILLLSLISGRNPDFLIGQHVLAAPKLKRAKIEIIPTGYMLIDGGNTTAAAYMSNTMPIPADKKEIAVCTAIAGSQLGMDTIYLDGGSGAKAPVPADMITAVAKSIDIPVIVGGGIRRLEDAQRAWNAGANMVVIGTAIERNPELLHSFSTIARG